ncbi:fatty acid desaturase [Pleurocapsa sp. PCC 7319]|uniref:fatty acid desaturase n=1 Tax=Pleurocapsa sp. PCC 7319 TaxID=118161 RepID=UPI00034B36F7|nr:fatty acid desaturase [Pleurocapsa sp. PCC 7319]
MSSDRQWHIERSQKILQDHPEIKQYFGNYPLSIIPIIVLASLQWTVAWLVKDLSWWMIGLISLLVGQFILHSLAVFVHEAAHNLVLKGKFGSTFTLFLIELGSLSFGKSITYIGIHGKSHHRHLNDYQQDYEWWDKKQSRFLTLNPYWRSAEAIIQLLPGGVAITDLVMAQMIPAESRHIQSAYTSKFLQIFLTSTSLFLYALAWYLLSWQASLYLFWSLTFMVSNWGITFKGQSIAEHHIYQEGKTYSTYQWTNIPFFNTGYHDEHHTFANVAWIHLPKIKKIAPEYFTNDNPYSYFHIWWLWAKSFFEPVHFNRYIPESNKSISSKL